MEEEYRKIVNELLGLPEDAEIEFKEVTDGVVKNLMICKRLDRIADVLEDINSALIGMGRDIEVLGECVGYALPRQGYVQGEGYNFLRIGGNVDTGI